MYPVEPTTRTLISLGLLFLKEGEGEEEDDVSVSEIPRDEIGTSLDLFVSLKRFLEEGSWVWRVEARGKEW